jgi:hypothetical protein
MPRRKKDPSVRARRNQASTTAKLSRVDSSTTNQDAYAKLTVAQLRTEIDRRNSDGRSESEHLAKRGAKPALVAALVADDSPVPTMPDHPRGWWHRMAVEWWNDVWSSPMSPEWDASDIHNVALCALLVDDMWSADTPKGRKDAASEYRLQRADLGISPYSRRRLEWTIESAAEAQDRGNERRSRRTPPARPATGATKKSAASDPRAVLSAVK